MAASLNIERLTPLDLLMPKTYIATVLTFQTSNPSFPIASTLQGGLESLSIRLPWLRGRVFSTVTQEHDQPGLGISWNPNDNAPVLIDKGSTSLEYEGLSTNGMPPVHIPTEVWPAPAMIDDSLTQAGAPVFAASIFGFSDNKAVGLCVCMHHNAVDATGLAEVLRLWTEEIRDVGTGSPIYGDRLGRLSRSLSSELGTISALSPDSLFTLHPEYSRAPPTMPTSFPSCTCRLFSIPMSRINDIKERVAGGKSPVPTTNTVACAIVWSAVARARQKRDPNLGKETSRLVTAVNGRQRIAEHFSTPNNPYLGNAVLYSLAKVDAAALSTSLVNPTDTHLNDICDIISRSWSSEKINSRHIAEVYNLVDGAQDYRAIFPGWDLFNTRDLTITSWADLDLYQLDFGAGLGKPGFVRVRYTEADGVAIVLPRRRARQGDPGTDTPEVAIEIMLMLRADDMEFLEQDETWRAFTS